MRFGFLHESPHSAVHVEGQPNVNSSGSCVCAHSLLDEDYSHTFKIGADNILVRVTGQLVEPASGDPFTIVLKNQTASY